jgi:hypothetical protein
MGAKGGDRRPPISTLSAQAMPPFWQYFSRLQNKRQTSPSRTPKDVNHGHPSIFPCK